MQKIQVYWLYYIYFSILIGDHRFQNNLHEISDKI